LKCGDLSLFGKKEFRLPDSFDAIGAWTQALLTNRFIALTLGGTLGTHACYWLDRWISTAAWSRGFPWGTLVLLGLVGIALAVLLVGTLVPRR
jgi:hypothetical protein